MAKSKQFKAIKDRINEIFNLST
ncbi:cpsH domain protein, partial [Vibrio harveyi]